MSLFLIFIFSRLTYERSTLPSPASISCSPGQPANNDTLSGDIDRLISNFAHCKFVASPVFGAPTAADSGNLVLTMSGDYRSKKEVAYLTVPGVGRKVIDLGGNIEKGTSSGGITTLLSLWHLHVLQLQLSS